MHNDRFYSLNHFLRQRHGGKVMKLSIDGGFTCPNRDGTLSHKGCIFCSSEGSGDFSGCKQYSITDQMQQQIDLLQHKWPNINHYIAYFQAYSNTYGDLQTLKNRYEEALAFKQVVGLAIGTRPDCINEQVLNLLSDFNQHTHLWIELGLQTIHEKTAHFINRSYELDCFYDTVMKLHQENIEVVVHIILGLPGETKKDMLATAAYLAKLPIQGVKIHMLHVLDNAPLGSYYNQKPFKLLTEEEYVELVGEILSILPSHFVIHRLTGDGDASHLIGPLWTKNKRGVLNHITKHLKEHKILQGNNQNIY